MPGSRKAARGALVLVAALAAWNSVPSAFTGSSAAAPRGALTQMNGYRLDWMLEKKDGTSDLQTQDGYWVGEVGFERSQGAQGLRYRMRPTREEYLEGREVNNLMYAIGPVKFKVGEAFGGCATNEALRQLKRKYCREGERDPAKVEENKYWKARYGYERWDTSGSGFTCDQATGQGTSFFRGLAAWSGLDPKKEERGVTWFEGDWGKPWLQKYVGLRLPGWVSGAQVEKEFDTGKLSGAYMSLPKPNDNAKVTGIYGPSKEYFSLPKSTK
jgi:hypothetical protein